MSVMRLRLLDRAPDIDVRGLDAQGTIRVDLGQRVRVGAWDTLEISVRRSDARFAPLGGGVSYLVERGRDGETVLRHTGHIGRVRVNGRLLELREHEIAIGDHALIEMLGPEQDFVIGWRFERTDEPVVAVDANARKVLRTLAEHASKGHWRHAFDTSTGVGWICDESGRTVIRSDGAVSLTDVSYLAAVEPRVVLALCDRIDALERMLAERE